MPNVVDHDIDRMLREFFRREMPHPWPPLRLPAQAPQPKSLRRRGLWHSQLSLAASLGFLVMGLGLTSQILRAPQGGRDALENDARPGKAIKPTEKLYHKPATTPEKPASTPSGDRKPFTSPLSSLPR